MPLVETPTPAPGPDWLNCWVFSLVEEQKRGQLAGTRARPPGDRKSHCGEPPASSVH